MEVVQRIARMLEETDRQHYADLLAPYVQGSAGQYLYRLQPAERPRQLEVIGGVMRQLVVALAAKYGQNMAYQVLVRRVRRALRLDGNRAAAEAGGGVECTQPPVAR